MSDVDKNLELEIGHVLFVDIVGYSKLLINEQGELLEHLKEMVRGSEQVRAADAAGKLIRLATGDGMALVFRNSPEAPAQCALELARADKAHPELRLRMGIHSGPINEVADVNDRANVTGAGINMAQRVMDCGDAGHILLSKRVADDLAQYRHWQPLLHDLGECEVKHGTVISVANLYTEDLGNPKVPEKFQLAKEKKQTAVAAPSPARSKRLLIALAILICLLLGLGIVAVFFAPATTKFFSYQRAPAPNPAPSASPTVTAPAIPEKSIAVLPFENRSEEKANAYFADGIQDEILTRLSKIADLKVISRTSTEHYKSAPENLPEIAKQLGVAHIVEGSVQKSGDAVRVNVQLIKAANDSHLWAETFDRKLTDIFTVESEVAKAIADQLRAKLTGPEEQVIAAKPTENLDAYDAYLRALAYTIKPAGGSSLATALGAQKYFREAVRLDPKFALAWALLSDVDATGYVSEALPKTAALREEIRQAAETALTLQPNLGEAVLAKGFYYYACLKDYDTAVRYYEQAGKALPNSSRVFSLLGGVARRRGQWDQNESYFNEAERLDPRNAQLLANHAASYIMLRRFPEALRKLDQVLEITPDEIDPIVYKAGIAQAEGDLARAAALLSTIRPKAEDVVALETQVYQAVLERRPAQMIARMKELLAKPDPALNFYNGELRFYLGWAQEVAGDKTGAQETWRQAVGELEPFLEEQPENFTLIGDLALTNAFLGNKDAALALAERGLAVVPVEKDAKDGGWPIEILARVAARVGEPDRAITALEKLLTMPYEGPVPTAEVPLTPARLRLDPMFDPLRNDPRFEKLVAWPAPKDPKE
ncbi:MAG: hypothetical protein M3Q46_13355 [Verrucomicrobiota bacterium]|nr:hypothetical protein [Verrucomicrobiota bacterium]